MLGLALGAALFLASVFGVLQFLAVQRVSEIAQTSKRMEAFYGGEIGAWHNVFRDPLVPGSPADSSGRIPILIAESFDDPNLTADPYNPNAYQPGQPLNEPATRLLDTSPSIIQRYDYTQKNIRYSKPVSSPSPSPTITIFPGYLVLKRLGDSFWVRLAKDCTNNCAGDPKADCTGATAGKQIHYTNKWGGAGCLQGGQNDLILDCMDVLPGTCGEESGYGVCVDYSEVSPGYRCDKKFYPCCTDPVKCEPPVTVPLGNPMCPFDNSHDPAIKCKDYDDNLTCLKGSCNNNFTDTPINEFAPCTDSAGKVICTQIHKIECKGCNECSFVLPNICPWNHTRSPPWDPNTSCADYDALHKCVRNICLDCQAKGGTCNIAPQPCTLPCDGGTSCYPATFYTWSGCGSSGGGGTGVSCQAGGADRCKIAPYCINPTLPCPYPPYPGKRTGDVVSYCTGTSTYNPCGCCGDDPTGTGSFCRGSYATVTYDCMTRVCTWNGACASDIYNKQSFYHNVSDPDPCIFEASRLNSAIAVNVFCPICNWDCVAICTLYPDSNACMRCQALLAKCKKCVAAGGGEECRVN